MSLMEKMDCFRGFPRMAEISATGKSSRAACPRRRHGMKKGFRYMVMICLNVRNGSRIRAFSPQAQGRLVFRVVG